MKIARALISVSDKTGLDDFAKRLHALGVEILSTGGTARFLAEHGRGGDAFEDGGVVEGLDLDLEIAGEARAYPLDRVERAGVINDDLDKALTPFGFFFPPDPASSKVCTLGGNVATNSGGPSPPFR